MDEVTSQPKPWAEVSQAPAFKALPPDKQEAARQQYFDQVVAPKITPEKLSSVRNQFDQETRAALQNPVDDATTSGKGVAQAATQQAPELSLPKEVKKLRGLDDDIDYQTGTDFAAKLLVERSDNPKEAKAALERLYGVGNAGQDSGGRWWVKKNGKKVEVYGGGQGIGTMLKKQATGVAATSSETAGAGAGAAIGGIFAPETFGASIPIGAGLGAVVGKGLDETLKYFQDFYKKSNSEELNTLVQAGELNTLLSMVPGMAGKTAKSALEALRTSWFGVTDSGRRLASRIIELGGRPSVAQLAPKAKTLSYDQMVRNLISGNPLEKQNTEYIFKRLEHVLSADMSPDEVKAVLSSATDKSAARSTSEVGEAATREATEHLSRLQAGADSDLRSAQAVAEKELRIFDKLSKTVSPIGKETAAEISANRAALSRSFNRIYQYVDEMSDGAEVVPLAAAKKKAQEIISGMDPAAVPAIINRLLKAPDMVSIMKAHTIRSELNSMAFSPNLTPDIQQHMLGELGSVLSSNIKSLGNSMSSKEGLLRAVKATGIPENKVAQASKLLQRTDSMYSDSIKKYNDQVLNKLVSSVKAGFQPDATVTADMIASEGWTERTKTIIGMLSPELKRKVAGAHAKMLLDTATKLSGSLENETRGDALLKVLEKQKDLLGPIYDPVFGPGFKDRFIEAAKDVAAANGKISIPGLQKMLATQGSVGVFHYLGEHLAKIKGIDAFVKDNFMSSLTSKDPAVIDRAYDMIVQPGNETKLVEANRLFGSDSDTMKAIRKHALLDAIGKASVELPTKATTIAGTEMDKAISSFTKKQQEILFPDGLAEDLKAVSEEARMLFPMDGSSQDFGGSLQAASIKAHIPFSMRADLHWLKAQILGFLADRETLVRILGAGFREKTLSEQQIAIVLKRAILANINALPAGPGHGKTSEPTQVIQEQLK